MMILKSLPSFLLSTSSLLICLTNWCNSAAPTDLPPNCTTVSTNQRALLDSCCYATLLPASDGTASTWSAVDVDGDGMTWTAEDAGLASCLQIVMISNASDDWLITQYINTTLDSGINASELVVDIQFTCMGNCSTYLDLLHYPVDSEQSQPFNGPFDDTFVKIGPVSSGSNRVTGITTAGLYLALQATGTVSVTVNRISIILTVCEEETISLINFPLAYSSTSSVSGSCLANSNSSGSPTGTCGASGTWTTSSSCVCDSGYFLDSGTCKACPMGTYKPTVGNESCSPCPDNSMATIEGSTICECEANYVRPTSNAAGEACSGCESGYFLINETCMACPNNSENTDPSSNSCTCKGSSVTLSQESTTMMEDCSSCPENWRASMMTPLVCERCPVRSVRGDNDTLTSCSCTPGYEMKLGQCVARVMIPPLRLELKEGSAADPAEITLMLSAPSYGFTITYNISVEPMFRGRISPPSQVFVPEENSSVDIFVTGDNEALTPSYNLTVDVRPTNDYAGEGAIEVTIMDDDYVSVGFLVPQRTMFNESEGTISIILTRNASIAQDMMVNVVSPQDASVSVEGNPIRVSAESDRNIPVMLRIQDDATGGEADESIALTLELVSPINFEGMIDLKPSRSGVTDQLVIVIRDDDPPPTSTTLALGLNTIIGIAVACGALLILIIIVLLVSICICRFNANRQGFYVTDEDKATNPPSMLRYSASLRSISSQTVVPIIDGKGQVAEKENEFYV